MSTRTCCLVGRRKGWRDASREAAAGADPARGPLRRLARGCAAEGSGGLPGIVVTLRVIGGPARGNNPLEDEPNGFWRQTWTSTLMTRPGIWGA